MTHDEVITPEKARAIQADAVRKHALVGWVVSAGEDEHHGKLVARMLTVSPSAYVLVADALGGAARDAAARFGTLGAG